MNQDDDPTRLIGRNSPPPVPGHDPGDEPTRIIRPTEPVTPDAETSEFTQIYGHPEEDDMTTLVDSPSHSKPVHVEEDMKTVLFRPNRREPTEPTSETSETLPATSIVSNEPVVGWLVVIEGNGAGHSHSLSYGINSIGRDSSQRVSLDYGDQTISRENHVAIAYDPRGRNFFIQQGSGTSLGYLNDEPILQPTKLLGGEKINLGDTTLAFVPFCSTEFDWEDA